MADSLSVSLGFKYNFPGTYSSTTVHYSFSTDVEPDETPDEAKARAEALVAGWVDAKFDEVSAK